MSAKKLHPQADYLLDLLVAAGHITREKAFQARDIALEFGPAGAPGAPQEAAGWKLVPIEATPEMVTAGGATAGIRAIDGAAAMHQLRGNPLPVEAFATGSPLAQAWRAMLDAAPGAPGQEAAAVQAVGQAAMLKALKFHPSASHVSPDFRDLFNTTLQQHFDNYVRYCAALAGGDGGEG